MKWQYISTHDHGVMSHSWFTYSLFIKSYKPVTLWSKAMIFLQTGTGSLQYYKNIIPNPSRGLLFCYPWTNLWVKYITFLESIRDSHRSSLYVIMIFITFALIDQKRHSIGCDHYQCIWWDNGAKVKLIAIREPSVHHTLKKRVWNLSPLTPLLIKTEVWNLST